jgi:hypothetical protein
MTFAVLPFAHPDTTEIRKIIEPLEAYFEWQDINHNH